MKSRKSRPVTLRLSESLIALADLACQQQRTDRSTMLRQWLYQGAEEQAVRMVSEGRLSIGRAAELLDLTHYDIYRIAQAKGIELGGSPEQYQESPASAAPLLAGSRKHQPTVR